MDGNKYVILRCFYIDARNITYYNIAIGRDNKHANDINVLRDYN